ncbi:ATP-dependent DNA helicase [Ferrimonas gelatinilytica]|uniref:ATP-dependent DNA helicase n=1 Tax=Ferrimonas gelatinilytica TaxID=1255257 RepID=A0ABP9RUQ8_9GAMM
MSRLEKEVALALGSEGLLAEGLPGFRPRAVQQQLGAAAAANIQQGGTLVAEAGTGIGKTFAYLLPALLSGKKALISTGSKNLQDQLFFKDLPTLLALMERPPSVALLKGRNNYLCHYHLNRRLADLPADPELVDHLMRIRAWSSGSHSGDFAELTSVPEDSLALSMAGSRHDNCLGQRCPEFDRCCLHRARNRAAEADLVVINHHLFFADMALKETGFAEILPSADLFVFDEAHQLPDIALGHFAETLSTRQLNDLVREMRRAYQGPLRDCRQLESAAARVQAAAADLYEVVAQHGGRDWAAMRTLAPVASALASLEEALRFAQRVLVGQLGRDEMLDRVFERLDPMLARLQLFMVPGHHSLTVECHRGQLTLRACPLSVAERCQAFYRRLKGSWLFTSATLTVAGRFEHFNRQLGLTSPVELVLDSPFDYGRQALLCVPRGLPQPGEPQLPEALARIAQQLVEAADGRTFLLFTSHSMMQAVGALLSRRLSQPLLMQGMGSKRSLLQRFSRYGNAVLLATASFWEGVDVRGRALVCVMIDKLPFVSPEDPLQKARCDAVTLRGGDPFNEVQLPLAVIALKQGVGRLIRGEQDRGVMVICDPRLVHRPYGGLFLASLPPMSRTRDLGLALARLREL